MLSNMLPKSLIALCASALLLGACDTSQQAVSAPPPPPAAAPSYMVFFDWDRSDLSPQALATIGQAASAYKSSGNASIGASGYTDTSGLPDYNVALSQRRAEAVKGALVQAGVPAGSIQTVGRGEADLLVPTPDGVREPQNRRVVISGLQVASAAWDPRAYCKALSDKFREYRTAQATNLEAAAMAKCEAGDYAAGIPVLEDSLITAKVPLPNPGYRWPGRPV
jgi:hypothetical protein